MIYGDGGPIAKLMDEAGILVISLTLPRPVRREANGYEDVVVSLGTDADGNAVEDYQGVRYHGKFSWLSHADNQADMVIVQRLANWRGRNRTVTLTPHSDATGQQIRCEVSRTGEKPVNGKVTGEEITIELWGVDILPDKPNPAYVRISRVFGRGYVGA